MKIQLVNPPVYLNVYAMTALRPSLPLGLAYVAAALRKDGHDVSVLDAVGEAPDQVTPGLRKQISALGLRPEELIDQLDGTVDAFAVGDALLERGWFHDRQAHPDSLHSTVSNSNTGVIDDYLEALRASVAEVRGERADDRSTEYATLE